ncbi:UNKNOWN [Stylonychia lemnae]|uniref:Uncharacterized protein n=1 Tax=Stylonychia lemnae TaxID=5949 RepID=A0A078AV08_STYLE|nr:UNKNOWN [Stylonychia lemnae]|eukprot:CDW86039.1 UNKNOWN [Stylonychia lemnae]
MSFQEIFSPKINLNINQDQDEQEQNQMFLKTFFRLASAKALDRKRIRKSKGPQKNQKQDDPKISSDQKLIDVNPIDFKKKTPVVLDTVLDHLAQHFSKKYKDKANKNNPQFSRQAELYINKSKYAVSTIEQDKIKHRNKLLKLTEQINNYPLETERRFQNWDAQFKNDIKNAQRRCYSRQRSRADAALASSHIFGGIFDKTEVETSDGINLII